MDSRADSPIRYTVAQSLNDVTDAWRLTYFVYLDRGLIDPNPFGLYTTAETVSANSTIFLGRSGPLAVSTATATIDGPAGLPLDSVFGDELEALRRDGRRLVEIGMVSSTGASRLFELLRLAVQFGRMEECSDVICGMHPARIRLYEKLFGMSPVGSPRLYKALRDQPVVLMKCVCNVVFYSKGLYRLESIMQREVSRQIFADRFRLDPQALKESGVAQFIEWTLAKKPNSPS